MLRSLLVQVKCMKVDTENWSEFFVRDIFSIYNGKGITQEEIEENPGNLEAVQSGENKMGVIGYIDRDYCIKNDYTLTDNPCLTVARTGTSGFVSFHPHGCVVGDSAKILELKEVEYRNNNVYLFLRTVLEANRYRYSYGRKVKEDLYYQTIVELPATANGKPDWRFMENFIKKLNYKPLTTKVHSTNIPLCTNEWKEFHLGGDLGLFDIKKGKRLTSDDQTEGNTIYIGAIDSNNGVANYIGQSPIHSGNTISLSYNGSVGEAFYQPLPYWATDDVNALYFKESNNYPFNKYIALFICTILKKEKYRFSYGRKWTLENMNDTIIKLPVNSEGKPNWEWIEKYMKSLLYSDRI